MDDNVRQAAFELELFKLCISDYSASQPTHPIAQPCIRVRALSTPRVPPNSGLLSTKPANKQCGPDTKDVRVEFKYHMVSPYDFPQTPHLPEEATR